MIWQTIRRVGQPVAWLISFGGQAWTLVSWIWGGGLTILGDLGPPEYSALTAMFSVVLVYSTCALVQPFRPSTRLEQLCDEIARMRRSLEYYTESTTRSRRGLASVHYAQVLSGQHEEQLRSLARALDGLSIPHPSITEGNVAANWRQFLIRLFAEARVRNIRCARHLFGKMKSQNMFDFGKAQ